MMKSAAAIRFSLLALAIAAGGCASSSASSQMKATSAVSVPARLAPVRSGYLQAWTAGDPEAMSRYFTNYVVVVIPGDRYTGWDATLLRWLRPMMKGMTEYTTVPNEFMTLGEDIVERGRYMYTITDANGKTESKTALYTQRWTPDKTTGEYRIAAVDIS